MMIAYGRLFVMRWKVQGSAGRFRVRELDPGVWVRLVKRVGPGMYMAERVHAPAWSRPPAPRRTPVERMLAGERVLASELSQFLQRMR